MNDLDLTALKEVRATARRVTDEKVQRVKDGTVEVGPIAFAIATALADRAAGLLNSNHDELWQMAMDDARFLAQRFLDATEG